MEIFTLFIFSTFVAFGATVGVSLGNLLSDKLSSKNTDLDS